jgi:chorismate-pyruvate lyase
MRNLIANQPQTDAAIGWRPASLWPPDERPEKLWPWLSHAGSLTEKLRTVVGGTFHVKVLHEGVTPLSAEDAVLLHTLPGTAARQREVYLCGDAPLVYARTLALADAADWLSDLSSQPLGDRVFAENDTQRSVIAVAQLDTAQPWYRAVVANITHPPATIWARRSVLTVRGSHLLIYECFLGVPER